MLTQRAPFKCPYDLANSRTRGVWHYNLNIAWDCRRRLGVNAAKKSFQVPNPHPHFKFAKSYKKTKLITVGSKSYQTPCVMCAAVVWNQPISTTAFRTAIIIVSMKQPWVIRVGESLLTINITKPKQNNRKLHHIISMRYTLYPGRPTVKPLILDAP